jgi:hypothetical protein
MPAIDLESVDVIKSDYQRLLREIPKKIEPLRVVPIFSIPSEKETLFSVPLPPPCLDFSSEIMPWFAIHHPYP